MVDASPVALVTGGASGIGWATAQEFLRAGYRVVIGDLNHERVAGLSLPAERSAIEVLVANGVDVRVDSRDAWVPTPALSHPVQLGGRTWPVFDGRRTCRR